MISAGKGRTGRPAQALWQYWPIKYGGYTATPFWSPANEGGEIGVRHPEGQLVARSESFRSLLTGPPAIRYRPLRSRLMGDQLKRREFIGLFGGAAASWALAAPGALAAPARQAGKPPIIGFLGAGTPSSHGELFAALVRRLRGLGWIGGSTVAIGVRSAARRSTDPAPI